MKTLKRIGIGLGILILLLLILAFFLPREMDITAKGKIDAPAQYTYNILNDFQHQSKWDPWLTQDTTMKFQYGDQTMGEGAYVDYESKQYGKGRTTRNKSIKNEQILLSTKADSGSDATMSYNLSTEGDQSELTWNFKTEMSFPFNLMNFFFSRSMKGGMQDGIATLSKLSNERWKKGEYNGFTVNSEVIEDRNYVINRDIVQMDKVPEFYARNLGPIFQKIQAAGVVMDGKPSGLVYKHDMKNNTLDIAVAVPIKEEVIISGTSSASLPAGKVVSIDFYGDPDGSQVAHQAIDEYMRDRDLFVKYPVVEEYVTDPSEEKDPAKWLTKIRYYLAD